MFYFIVGILAFCSIAYELLLGQMLSAFLGNTVLRYSVTIGLYMLSMGIGSFTVRDRLLARPVLALQIVEILLSLIGGFSLVFLFWLDSTGAPGMFFSFTAHSLIVLIGILTGMEIPLLIGVRNLEVPDSDIKVLGLDYIGACAGALIFAFYLYPVAGLTLAAFMIATLNALVGVCLVTEGRVVPHPDNPKFRSLLGTQGVLLLTLAVCAWKAPEINELMIDLYLGRSI